MELGAADDFINHPHRFLQCLYATLVRRDYLLPVPLVDVDRVHFVDRFVGPDRIHVGIQPFAGPETVPPQRQALPLGQRLHDLHRGVAVFLHREPHRPLNSVEIVIDPRPAAHEQRSRHPFQSQ